MPIKNYGLSWVMVAQTYDPSTWEEEAGESLSQPGLQSSISEAGATRRKPVLAGRGGTQMENWLRA